MLVPYICTLCRKKYVHFTKIDIYVCDNKNKNGVSITFNDKKKESCEAFYHGPGLKSFNFIRKRMDATIGLHRAGAKKRV